MRRPLRSRWGAPAASTLAELMVASAITSLLCGALITSALLIQKSFIASRHHILAQAEQMRLIDFMGLDLRRALTVTTANGRLDLTIPDYYDSTGAARDPVIRGGMAVYGTTPLQVSYFKEGPTVFRSEGTSRAALANDVSDFALTFQDLGQSIAVSVTFLPKFQFSSRNWSKVRDGTATFSTTLLRNKRQN